MRKTKPVGTTTLPAPNGHIVLTINVEYESADFAANGPAAPSDLYVTFSVVGTVGGHTVDLGVHRDDVPVRGMPADLEALIRTEPVASLIAEYRQRIAELTIHLGRLQIATGDGVAVTFSVDGLEFLRHCLTLTELRWRDAIAQAETDARQPQHNEQAPPGFLNITPTPGGFLTAARLFGVELARVEKLTTRVGQLLGLARDAAADSDGDGPQ
jgi:hypothetical protein